MQKPVSETSGRPSITSQRCEGVSAMQPQSVHDGSRGSHTYSIPSAGPQREVHVCDAGQCPAPQGVSVHAAQSATGPDAHEPPWQTIASPQHASPHTAPSAAQLDPIAPVVSAGHSSAGGAGHSTARHDAAVHRPDVQTNGAQRGAPGVGQHAPQLAPSITHGSPSLGARPQRQTGSASAIAQAH